MVKSAAMAESMKPFQIRYDDDWMHQVDEWRRVQPDIPGRAEAIRRLVEIGLEAERSKKRRR